MFLPFLVVQVSKRAFKAKEVLKIESSFLFLFAKFPKNSLQYNSPLFPISELYIRIWVPLFKKNTTFIFHGFFQIFKRIVKRFWKMILSFVKIYNSTDKPEEIIF